MLKTGRTAEFTHTISCVTQNYKRHVASNFGDLDTEKAETDINTFLKILQK